jgi:hypothetical protein
MREGNSGVGIAPYVGAVRPAVREGIRHDARANRQITVLTSGGVLD